MPHKDKERRREYNKKYREINKEKMLEHHKKYKKSKKGKESAKRWLQSEKGKEYRRKKDLNYRESESNRRKRKIRWQTLTKYGSLPKGYQYHHITDPYDVDEFVVIPIWLHNLEQLSIERKNEYLFNGQ